jgi:hypothetical protein
MIKGIFLALLAALAFNGAGHACETALRRAEAENGIPDTLLVAMGTHESGLDPLAINADGTPYHPAGIQEAKKLVLSLRAHGAKFIDVGCLQIDLSYHPDAFATLDDAFDPMINSRYGAHFLASLKTKHGDWPTAVAFYHRGNDKTVDDKLAQAAYLDDITDTFMRLTQQHRRPRQRSPKPSQDTHAGMKQVQLATRSVWRPVRRGTALAEDDRLGILKFDD